MDSFLKNRSSLSAISEKLGKKQTKNRPLLTSAKKEDTTLTKDLLPFEYVRSILQTSLKKISFVYFSIESISISVKKVKTLLPSYLLIEEAGVSIGNPNFET